MVIKRLIVISSAAILGACTLDKQAAPALTGPSELGLSISVSASPDQLPEDGQSTSTIRVVALDANSQPVAGLSLKGDVRVSGAPTDVRGTLSSQTISTDNSGVASVRFTAPTQQPSDDPTKPLAVQLHFTPVGSNFANDAGHDVTMQLSAQSVVALPGPIASFTFSSTASGVHFDASASRTVSGRSIVTYEWDFGDGTEHGFGVTVDHQYTTTAGQTVLVTLRVTDSAGQIALSTVSIKF